MVVLMLKRLVPGLRLLALLGVVCGLTMGREVLAADDVTKNYSEHRSPNENTAEEGEDGADEVPEDPNARVPTIAELRKTYRLVEKETTEVSAFKAPKIPNLSAFTADAVAKKVDASTKGNVRIDAMLSEPGFKALTTAIGQGLSEFARRQNGGLRGVFIENGHMTLAEVAAGLPKDVMEEVSPGVYVARLPILVRHGASLLIGRTVKQLRLSQERGALLAVEGDDGDLGQRGAGLERNSILAIEVQDTEGISGHSSLAGVARRSTLPRAASQTWAMRRRKPMD